MINKVLIINSAFAKEAIKACVFFGFYFQNSALKMSNMKYTVIFPLLSRWNLLEIMSGIELNKSEC